MNGRAHFSYLPLNHTANLDSDYPGLETSLEESRNQTSKRMSGPKAILVTGGAGFVGTTLSMTLAAQGHKVTVLDDLSSGKE